MREQNTFFIEDSMTKRYQKKDISANGNVRERIPDFSARRATVDVGHLASHMPLTNQVV
jgi:hypothetical protein